MTTTSRNAIAVAAIAGTLAAITALAGEPRGGDHDATGPAHTMLQPDAMTWGPAPAVFPQGAQMAVIQGDPSAPGRVVTVRLRMPKGYAIPPHFHPTDEAVTILSGSFTMGTGDAMDQTSAKTLGPGGYAVVPAQAHHWAMAAAPTEVQVHMIGPFAITYVNPADDPQAKASASSKAR